MTTDSYNPYYLRQAGFAQASTLGNNIVGPSGIGGTADKLQGLSYRPTLIYARHVLDTAYIESWAFAAFVDYKVDDMLIRWRKFEADDEGVMLAMQEQEEKYKVPQKLAQAMKWGRLFGSALLVIVTAEGMPHRPLDVERVSPGMLRNLFVVDRFSAEIVEHDENIMSEQYGEPSLYRLTLPFGNMPTLDVHASRILRFDGIELPAPLSAEASVYDRDWGQSSLIRVATAVEQDVAMYGGVGHLGQEASIAYIKTPAAREAAAGQLGAAAGGEQSIGEVMEEINRVKSLYRMIALAEDEELKRLAVNFGGIADILDRHAQRVAAAGGYPATRLLGTSPVGMNATGEGDMKNYVVMIEALRKQILPGHMKKLDAIMAADAGLMEPPEYRWLSLFDMSDQEVAELELNRVNTVVAAGPYISDEEARQALMETTEVFAFIDPADVPEKEPEPMAMLPGPPGQEMIEDARRMRPDPRIGSHTQRRFINRQVSNLYRLSRQMGSDLQEAFVQLADEVEEALRPHLAALLQMLPQPEPAESTEDSLESDVGPDVVREVSRLIENLHLHDWQQNYLTPIAEDYVLRSSVATFQGLDFEFDLAVNIPDADMREFIRQGGTRMGLLDLTADTKTAVYHTLLDSRLQGLGMQDTADLLKDMVKAGPFVNAGPEYRAQVIARTEVRTAQVASAGLAYEASEVVDKVRIYDAQYGPARSDPHCIARNGKVVTLAQARQERQDEHPNGTYMEAPEIEPLESLTSR